MEKYDVTVIEYPAKHLVGQKIQTTMAKAHEDCSALWQAFEPRLGELAAAATANTGSFGVSVMLTPEEFDYWAALEVSASAAVPPGLGVIGIPTGLYAKATVPNLEKLEEVYMFLYDTWLKGQTTHTYNEAAPCFEWYPPNWQPTEALDVFMAVRKL